MKDSTVCVEYNEDKLSALKMYIEQKNLNLETEMQTALEQLYRKVVPSGVREFIEMKQEFVLPKGARNKASKSETQNRGESQ